MYPNLVIDIGKLKRNTRALCEMCHARGISVAAVTKLYCADRNIVEALIDEPVDYLADSRLGNIGYYPRTDKKKMLLRAPMPDEVEYVVRFCDVSLNSEITTIRQLAEAAQQQRRRHGVVLMIDMGDLREGIYHDNLGMIYHTAQYVAAQEWLDLAGLGLNLTCYGSIIPTAEHMTALCGLAATLEERLSLKLPLISGGNSSSLHLVVDGKMPPGVTNLRLGEAIGRGEETAYQQPVPSLEQDVITLEAGIVELQDKPSYPEGEIGLNAFGEKPFFEDRGRRLRAIIALGRQDTDHNGLTCLDAGAEIVGASSDHLIVDLTQAQQHYRVGDLMRFSMNYSAILRGFTSEYVMREYVGADYPILPDHRGAIDFRDNGSSKSLPKL